MKKFFHEYSYNIVKMFVNQFAIALFGFFLAMATMGINPESESFDWLTFIVGIFAAVFYLFLIYTLAWDIGAKDKISIDVRKKPYRPHLGLLISLVANIPNLALAFLNIFSTLGNESEGSNSLFKDGIRVIIRLAPEFFNGMYYGIIDSLRIIIKGELIPLNRLWPTFFLTIIPAMLTSWLAYFLGLKNFRFFSFISSKKPPVDESKIKK